MTRFVSWYRLNEQGATGTLLSSIPRARGGDLRESAFGQIQPVSLHPCRKTPPRRVPFPPYSRQDFGYVAEPPHLRHTLRQAQRTSSGTKPPKKVLSLREAGRKRWRFYPPLRRVPMMTMPSHGYRGSSKRNHGYILLELIIGLVLLGVLMPMLMQCYQVSYGMLQTIAQRNTALQVRHYLQFVLREDMEQTYSLAQIGGDIVLYTDLGEIVYTVEEGVLKRRFSGQTLRLNPDLTLRCLSLTPVASARGLRLETTLGAVIVQGAAVQ